MLGGLEWFWNLMPCFILVSLPTCPRELGTVAYLPMTSLSGDLTWKLIKHWHLLSNIDLLNVANGIVLSLSRSLRILHW
jgi:hypothetical protein